ncbi:nucleotidyltransferase/DNA polymerase involved in DNA repair [Cellulomonas uda]|nr:nucleotidyltransferase/DNA polymerase involved in DNA repair [Cellulomonas uda]
MESRHATILHADLDAFYASVEQRDDPRLRGRPVAVGGGVVLAASYEAKRRGVRTAMGGRQARGLCPDLIVVRPRFDAYVEASREVFAIFRDVTPQVQGVSIDEAFLDVRGLRRADPTAPAEHAARVRTRVRDEVGLPITVGVARTPFLAKVASRVAKPDGLLVVAPDDEDAFLHPLPVETLWGVGESTATRLHGYGLRTAGDVAALDERVLRGLLGPAAGSHLYAVVHGRTPERVVTDQARGSVGAQRARPGAALPRGRTRRPPGTRGPGLPPDARRAPDGADRRAAAAVRRLLARDPVTVARVRHRLERRAA